LQQDGVLGSSINIQGLGGENVKILIDGVPVVGRLNGSVDLSQINMNNVERIEVIEGPLSVLYGSNALAGTINIITKTPEKQKTEINVAGLYESVGLYNFNIGLSTGNKRNSFIIDGGRNFFEGWSENDTTRSKQWNQKEQYFGQAKYRHKFNKLTLGYSFNGLWEQIKDRGDRLGDHSNYAFDNWFTTQRYINSLDFTFKAGVFSNANIIASYTYYQRLNTEYLRDLVNLEQQKIGEDTTFIHNVMTRGSFATQRDKKWNFQIGYDFNYETSKTERISQATVDMGDYAVFGSLQWTPSIRWNIQPGLRYSYNTTFNSPLVPSINVKYDIDAHTKLRVSYAHGFRAPTIKELYLDFVDQNHMIFGNENLIPENSRNINVSLIWQTSMNNSKQNLKIEPALYYNNIEDKIQLVKTGTSNREFTYHNIAAYTTFGGKIDVIYSIHPDFTFNAGYSHLGYTNVWHEESSSLPEYLYTPEVSASFSYWRSSKKFNFNIIYKYTGQTPDYRVNENSELIQTTLPGFHWMDITATQLLWKNRVEITVGGKNLFDITSLNFSNGGTGGVHSGGANSSLISWGRTWFVKCKINI
jgi:outer membrane receptor for ferrienterochelin and colicins